jgi:hypothetical protein
MSILKSQVASVIEFLKIHSKTIAKEGSEGNETANNIMRYYHMLS